MKQAPLLFLGFLKGLAIALTTTVEGYLFLLLGVFVGLASENAWLGVAIAWSLYTIFYMLSQYIKVFNSKADLFARLMNRND